MRLNEGCYVRFWPKADMPKNAIDVAFGGKADIEVKELLSLLVAFVIRRKAYPLARPSAWGELARTYQPDWRD
jgi:hypothetical protein